MAENDSHSLQPASISQHLPQGGAPAAPTNGNSGVASFSDPVEELDLVGSVKQAQEQEGHCFVGTISLDGWKCKQEPLGPHSKSRHTNQDRCFFSQLCAGVQIFGVFDGHGPNGHRVSEIVSNEFQKQLTRRLRNALAKSHVNKEPRVSTILKRAFARVEEKLIRNPTGSGKDMLYASGTTATACVRIGRRLWIGYVGDSKCVAMSSVPTVTAPTISTAHDVTSSPSQKRITLIAESPIHDLDDKDEADRILSCGGTITKTFFPHLTRHVSRIAQVGLNLSRSLGDLIAKPYGVVSEPTIVKIRTAVEAEFTVIILASDGLWDTVPSSELPKWFKMQHKQDAGHVARTMREIASVAWARRLGNEGRSDDVTLLVIYLRPKL